MIAQMIGVLLQISFATPEFPVISSPTPISTPSANFMVIEPTVYQDDMLSGLSTTEAQLQVMATQVVVNNNQVYFAGRPLLPDSSGLPEVFGYMRWVTSSAGYSLFGPFQPMVIHIGILLTLAILSVLFHYGQMLVSLIYRFIMWILNTILKFVPFMG